jgi:tRNA(Arg) A34 adenosine deaminase TadA
VDHPALNHRPAVRAGIMAIEASRLLREFFATRR